MPKSNAQILHFNRIDELIEKYPHLETIIKEFEQKLEGKDFAVDLTCYLIERFISKNQLCKDKILKAIDQLKDDSRKDIVNAIKKTSRALIDDKINIFISYKFKDEGIATEVVKSLKGVSTKFNVTYAKDFEKGKDYHEKIKRATRNAHWFILLLPDPADGWDWCLYESGLFRAREFPGDRLIVIHHKDNKIPDQISKLNAVIAKPEPLMEMLHELICKPNPIPGMDAINPDCGFIEHIAEQIAVKVSPPTGLKMKYFPDFVELKIEDNNPLDTDDDMDKAEIFACKPGELKLFKKGGKPDTWGELISSVVGKENDNWRTELREAIRLARGNNIPNEIYSTFVGAYGKNYRIILNGKREAASGKIFSYIITFIEDICVVDRQNIPPGINILASAVKLGFRFRWEVLENKLFHKTTMNKEDADELRESIERITKEAMNTGLMDSKVLIAQFASEFEKESIQSMYDKWYLMANEKGTGRLDVALDKLDAKETSNLLYEFLPLNKKFLKMSASRFSEMLA